jgi:uncharacterized membrane protein
MALTMTRSAIILVLALCVLPLESGQARDVPPQGSANPTFGDSSSAASTTQPVESRPRRYVLRVWYSLFGHLHNKIIHAPIGFGLSAFLLSLFALKRKEYEPGIRWLLLVAALGSIAAFITGTQQAVALEGGSKDWVIDVHRTLGITTMISLCAWAVFQWVTALKRWAIILGVIASLLILVTGFFGGVLAHG